MIYVLRFRFAFLLLVFAQFGCATMTLKSFQDDEFTLCCSGSESFCDFGESEKKVCSGEVTLISAKRDQEVTGYKSEYDLPDKNSSSTSAGENTTVIKKNVYCRVYKCAGTIDPDGMTKEAP